MIFPAFAQPCTVSEASSATTWTRAPVSIRPPILGSPTLPAPTTRHRLPSSFTNIGNKLLIILLNCSTLHAAGHTSLRQIARDRFDELSRQKSAQVRVGVTRKEAPQIFTRRALGEIVTQQTLDGFRNLSRRAAIPDWPRDPLIQPESTAQAEVISIHHLAVYLDLLALDADVGNPVLSATVGAIRDVQLQVLIKAGQPLFEFFDQPAAEALGPRNAQLAELGPAARARPP